MTVFVPSALEMICWAGRAEESSKSSSSAQSTGWAALLGSGLAGLLYIGGGGQPHKEGLN